MDTRDGDEACRVKEEAMGVVVTIIHTAVTMLK